MKRFRRHARFYGTTIVLAHFLVTLVHGATHAKLAIDLDFKGTVFVWLLIVLGPLVAMVLLWTSRYVSGLAILTLSMAGSLLFGLYHHFLVPGPDHVGDQVAGLAARLFAASAYGLLVSEVLGVSFGLYYLVRLVEGRVGGRTSA